jgi:hypothetical protein
MLKLLTLNPRPKNQSFFSLIYSDQGESYMVSRKGLEDDALPRLQRPKE